MREEKKNNLEGSNERDLGTMLMTDRQNDWE